MAFIESQSDYIFFLYGLIFIILGGIALIQNFIGQSRIDWAWLGAFGLLHGAHEWLGILVAAFPSSVLTQSSAALAGLASFAALFEFARTNATRLSSPAALVVDPVTPVRRTLRHWPPFALIALGVTLSLSGMPIALAVATHLIALTAGVWSAITLIAEGRQTSEQHQRRWLLLAAASLGAFSVAESLGTVLIGSGLLATTWGAGVPIQIAVLDTAHTVLAALTTLAVWRYIHSGRPPDAAPPSTTEAGATNFHYSLWLTTSLVIILAIGWYATTQLGNNAESAVRDRSKGATDILASHLRDEMARADLMAALLAKSPHILAALEHRNPDQLAAAAAALRQHTAVLESSIAFLMTPNGKVLVSTDPQRQGRDHGEDFGFLPYFHDSSAYGLVGKDLAVEPDLEQRGYYVSHPVTNATGLPIGVAVVKKVLG